MLTTFGMDLPIRWGSTDSGAQADDPVANSASVNSLYLFGPELGHGTYGNKQLLGLLTTNNDGVCCLTDDSMIGTVYKAKRRQDDEEFAIKELPKRRIKNIGSVKVLVDAPFVASRGFSL